MTSGQAAPTLDEPLFTGVRERIVLEVRTERGGLVAEEAPGPVPSLRLGCGELALRSAHHDDAHTGRRPRPANHRFPAVQGRPHRLARLEVVNLPLRCRSDRSTPPPVATSPAKHRCEVRSVGPACVDTVTLRALTLLKPCSSAASSPSSLSASVSFRSSTHRSRRPWSPCTSRRLELGAASHLPRNRSRSCRSVIGVEALHLGRGVDLHGRLARLHLQV